MLKLCAEEEVGAIYQTCFRNESPGSSEYCTYIHRTDINLCTTTLLTRLLLLNLPNIYTTLRFKKFEILQLKCLCRKKKLNGGATAEEKKTETSGIPVSNSLSLITYIVHDIS